MKPVEVNNGDVKTEFTGELLLIDRLDWNYSGGEYIPDTPSDPSHLSGGNGGSQTVRQGPGDLDYENSPLVGAGREITQKEIDETKANEFWANAAKGVENYHAPSQGGGESSRFSSANTLGWVTWGLSAIGRII